MGPLITVNPLCRHYFYVGITTCRNNDMSDYRPVGICLNIDLFVGISTCRTSDLSEHRPVGITTCRTIDPSEYKTVGISTCFSEYRPVGITTCRNSDLDPPNQSFVINDCTTTAWKLIKINYFQPV